MSAVLSQGSLLSAFKVQGRIIGAIMMRELHTRYGRENIGYLWMIAEPMMLASVIGLMHLTGGSSELSGDMQPVPFSILGYTCFILFRGIVNRSEGSLEANAPLLYHRQVTILDLTIARSLLELGGVFTTFLCLMGLLICTGWANMPARPLVVLAAWGLMLWQCIGQALVITAISHDNRTVGRLVHPYTYFMVGLSGAFVQTKWLPHPVQEIFTYVPLTSIFELLRHGWFISANLDFFFPMYLISSCVLLTWAGLVLTASLRDKVHIG